MLANLLARRRRRSSQAVPSPLHWQLKLLVEQLEIRLTPSFSLGGAANYGVLTDPSIHSFQSTSDSFYTGNIGIANTGGANQASPQVQWAGVLTGNIDFAGLTNITNTNGISGTVTPNVAAVNTAFNTMSTLSATLGAEAGTPLTLTGSAQTINASAGTLDASGNRVFTAGSGFVVKGPLTINGSASDYVVINIPSGQTAKFSDAITLTGGITDDHVLYNILGTGNEIGGAANKATVHGVIVGINRKFNMDAVTIDGRVIGGDSTNFQLVSNFRLVAPPSADLSITKTDGVTSVVPGGSTTYTIVASNAGPSAVTGASVSDLLPAGVTTASWSSTGISGGGSVTGPTSGTGSLATTVNLPAGGTATFSFTVQVDPSVTGSLVNNVTVTPPAGVTDPNPANNSASDTDTLTPQADLAITKTDGVTSAVPGGSTTYTIVVSNAGPSTAVAQAVTDNFPAAITAVQWTAVASAGSSAAASSGTGNIATTVTLLPGGTATFTAVAQISASATGTLTNTATVAVPPGDNTPANNTATDVDTLTPQADLAIGKTNTVTMVVPGTSDTFIIVVGNLGPSAVTGAGVSDPLPSGVTAATWTATGSSGGGTVTGPSSGTGALATTVNLPVNATVTFTFTVQIDPSATGTLNNTATVSPPAGVTDPNPANNNGTDISSLTPQSDLSITKTDGVTSVAPGGSTTYTIVVSNAGPSTAVAQAVTDLFPAEITAASWTAVASAGSSVAAASGTGDILTTVTLLPGGTATFTAVCQISPDAGREVGSLVNTATVAVPPGDNSPADNTATDIDSLTPLAGLAITKDDNQTTAVPGTSTTYTIVVSNAGPSAATGAALSDPVPAGVTAATWTFVGATGGGSVTGPQSGSGDLATTVDMPAGATVTFTFTAAIDPAAAGSLTNTATVTPSGGTPIGATDTDTLTPQADLAVTKDDGKTSAVPGMADTYTITVSNAGPSTVSSVNLTDAVPAALLNPTFGAPSAGGYDPATGVWSGLSLATGQSVTITLSGTIDPAATGTLTNTVRVAPPPGVTDPNLANNNDTDTDTLTPQADLAVTKDDGKTSAVPGTPDTYTITVTNNGPSTVSSVNLIDDVPAALLSPVFGAPSAGSYDPATGVWSGLSLATGQSVTIPLTGTIDPAATGSLTNTATVSPPAGVTDTNPANNSASDTDTLTPQADLAITKTNTVTTVVPGTSDTYIIVVSNLGSSAVTGASVADQLPAGVTSATWTATDSSGGGAVAGPSSGSGALATTVDLPVNATVTFTFTVQVDPSATVSLVNTATVSPPAGVTDTNPANNSATDTDSLTPQADLSITKTDGVLSVVPGGSTTYTIVVSNAGPSTAVDQAVTDLFPAAITAVSWTAVASAGSSVAAASGSGNIATTVTLLPGGTVTFTAVAQISPSATGTLTNTATVAVPPGDNTPADNTATDTDSLTPLTGLSITKTDGVTSVVPGTSTTYTIVVSNAGPSAATGAALSDPLPAGVTAATWIFVSATGGGSVTGPASGSGALATTVDLPAGATLTFGFTAAIDPAATGSLVNIARITPSGGTAIGGTDTDTLTPLADLAVTKDTDGTTGVVPGTTTTYTITVTNNGPSTVTRLTLIDSVPAALLNPVFGTPSAGAYDPATGLWSGLSLATGQSVTITLSATVDPAATGALTNTAHVAPPPGVTDPNPGNNNDSDTDTLAPQADLAVTKDDGKTTAVPGTPDTYTITVTNNGPTTVSSVNLIDDVPAALLNPVFGAPSAGGFDPATGVWSGLSLATGQSVTIPLTGTIDPAATGSLTNTATVSPPAGVTDTNPANNSASDTDTLTPQADLAITKTNTVTTVVPGTSDTYTIVVSNLGSSAVTGASVADQLPAGATGGTWTATASSGGGSVSGAASGSGALATTVDLPVNATVTFTFTVQIDPSATGTLVNTATVSPPSGVTDTNPANNTATDADTLTPQADLAITKTDGVTSVVPGGSTTYTIVVSNAGPSTAVAQAVTDDFPAAITAVSWTAVASTGSSVAAASGTGNIVTTVTLLPGGTAIFTAVAQISSSATGTLTNTAAVAVPPGDNTPGNDTATVTNSLTPVTGLVITKDDNQTTAVPGESTTYTITVSNAGPSDATGATLSDPMPAGVSSATWTFVSATGGGSVTGPASGTGDLTTTVDLPVNATMTFSFTAAIDPAATGSLVNIARITPSGGTPTGASDVDTLTPQADVFVTKDDGKTSAVPGTTDTYTITVSNAGPSTVSAVNLTDTLPAALLNPVFGTPSAGSYDPTTGFWNGLTLASGQTITITLTGTIDPTATGILTNTVTVSPPAGVTDPNPANDNDSDTDTLTPQADLAITKTDGKTTAVPGTPDTYTITVSNNGPSTVNAVHLSDVVPAALLSPAFGAPSAGSYDPATGVWSGLSLATGQSVTITLTGTIDPAATGTLVNTATVSPPAGVTDTNPANNNASDTDTLTPQADLAITKTDGKTSVVPDTPDTYTIVVSNAGPSNVTGASISDPLPAGATASTWTVTDSSGGGAVTGPSSGSGALATTVDLPVNASVTFSFTAQIDPSATGTLTNTATVSPPADVTDPNLANNTATDTDALTPQADLAITKTDGVTSVVPGTSTTYTIVVSNAGPSTAVDQAVTDDFPAAITAVSWTAVASAGSSVAAASGTGNIPTAVTLLPGGTAIFTAVAQISSSATGTLINTATVAVPPGDNTPGNNTATDTTRLTPDVDLTLTKTVNDPTPNVGDTITFTVTLTDKGPSNATGVQVTDLLPTGLTYVSSNASQGSYDPATGLWNLASVANGADAVLVVQARVVSPDAETNTATISHADQFDSDIDSSTRSIAVTPSSSLPVAVVSLKRYGFHDQPTLLVVQVSGPLEASSAEDLSNYTLILIAHGGRLHHRLSIAKAAYDPTTNTVTLHPTKRLPLRFHYELIINASTPTGVRDTSGQLIDGDRNGTPGGNFVKVLGIKDLAGKDPGFVWHRTFFKPPTLLRHFTAPPASSSRPHPPNRTGSAQRVKLRE